jgi:anti-sigma28 factor (negative regulator of flagellin synthesis)
MDERDRGIDRGNPSATPSVERIGARATVGRRGEGPAHPRGSARAVRQGRVDALRRRLAAGSLVPDPARIARALLERRLI